VVLPLAMAVGCGHDTPAADTPATGKATTATATVPQALRLGDGPVRVQGYVIVSQQGEARICEGLLGSYPPQCGGAWLAIEGLNVDTLPGRQTDQGVVWTGETVLPGVKQGRTLHVS
jgi:hypothetical protein